MVGWTKEQLGWTVELVKRPSKRGRDRVDVEPPPLPCFTVLPHRWVVERTFACTLRYRRMSKNYEYPTRSSKAFICAAMIRSLLKRLALVPARAPWKKLVKHPLDPGPPANLVPARAGDDPQTQPPDHLIFPNRDYLAYTRSSRFPHGASAHLYAFIVPEGSRSLDKRNNIDGLGLYVRGPEALAEVPVLVITGDQDASHPRGVDEATARYFGGDFVWLADIGHVGHGHMLMLEHGNLEVADVFLGWLRRLI